MFNYPDEYYTIWTIVTISKLKYVKKNYTISLIWITDRAALRNWSIQMNQKAHSIKRLIHATTYNPNSGNYRLLLQL